MQAVFALLNVTLGKRREPSSNCCLERSPLEYFGIKDQISSQNKVGLWDTY